MCFYDIGIVTGYRLDGLALDFLNECRLALGPTKPPVHWVQDFFPGGKVARRVTSWPALREILSV